MHSMRLTEHNTHSPTLYFDFCTLNRWDEGSFYDEGVIDDSDLIDVKFEWAPGCCQIEIDPVSEDVITFTGCPRLYRMVRQF